MGSSPKGTQSPELDDDHIRLLADVERGDPYYYESSSPQSSRYQQLCSLESCGYIRYCSYPEEFWVILPRGREFLLTGSQRRFLGEFAFFCSRRGERRTSGLDQDPQTGQSTQRAWSGDFRFKSSLASSRSRAGWR